MDRAEEGSEQARNKRGKRCRRKRICYSTDSPFKFHSTLCFYSLTFIFRDFSPISHLQKLSALYSNQLYSTALVSVANYRCSPNVLDETKGNLSLSASIQLLIQTKSTANAQRQFTSTADCLITIIIMTRQRKI